VITNRALLCLGDPNGIGPEISVGAAVELQRSGAAPPILVGDRFVVEHYADRLGVSVRELGVEASPASDCLELLPVDGLSPSQFEPGQVTPAAGRATVEYVRVALDALESGLGSSIVAALRLSLAVVRVVQGACTCLLDACSRRAANSARNATLQRCRGVATPDA
jgi:4-hydroxy-L-threonine phosphate dehydrogenase PdxA